MDDERSKLGMGKNLLVLHKVGAGGEEVNMA